MRDWRFWTLLGLFLAVLGLQLALPQLDSDQAVTGLAGLHVLRGEFPTFFWGQHHAGVPESYGAAVTFFLFGVSRLTLSLVPALAALGLVLALYRTGALLFGHGAGLLAILFASVVSPYVASHYVRARAYYVEHLLVGQLVLLGAALWLARPLGEPARSRALVAMGLAGGLGFYFGFQIVGALLPAALALLLVDPRLPLRRGAWLGLGAFVVGSAPLWAYNATHGWATFATGVRFQGRASTAEAARVVFQDLAPVVLGIQEYVGTPPFLPWPLALVVPVVAGGAVLLLLARVARGVGRLRRDPPLAGEAMLLAALATTVGAVWYGRYLQVPRYLVPLAPVLALVLARACQLVWRRARVVAVVAAAAYLGAVGVGFVRDLGVLRPVKRAQYARSRAADGALFAFLREQGLTRAYSYEYWLAPRLTFDAREEVIVAEPYNDRHPPYTQAVDAAPRPVYVVRTDVERFRHWVGAMASEAREARIGPYTLFWDFAPPPPVQALPRRGFRVRTSAGRGGPDSLTDGRLDTGWSSPGPAAPAWIEVDLGARRRVTGVTLVADQPARVAQFLEVHVLDAGPPGVPVGRLDGAGFTVTWRNGALRTAPGRTLTTRFPPVEARRLRLTDSRPSGSWAVTELFVLAPAASDPAPPAALVEGRGLEADGAIGPALVRYHEAMATAPDDPEGYAEFARLAAEVGLRAGPPLRQARRYLELGFADEARALYARLAETLGPDVVHAELAREQARLAAGAGDGGEARRLEAAGAGALSPRHRTGATFGRVVELAGYDLSPVRVRASEPVEVSYHWRLLTESPSPLVAYVHFRADRFQFGDDHGLPDPIPGLGRPQHLVERRRVVVPPEAPPGVYRIVVGVWDPLSRWRARLWWHGLLPTFDDTVQLGTLEVLPP